MTKATPMFLFQLADTLGMILDVDKSVIRGSVKRKIDFNGLRVSFTIQIISSWVGKEEAVVVAKVSGQLGLAVHSTLYSRDTEMFLLDLAHLQAPENMLEAAKVKHWLEAKALLQPAIAVQFVKDRAGSEHTGLAWKKVA